MRALYLKEKLVFEEKDIPCPVPKENEVLIKVKSVGVCGSDIHYWQHGRIGNFIVKKPMILGHELSGIIKEVGKNVKVFKVGELVVYEPGTTCGKCRYCREGRYNLCPDIEFFATPPYDGALREYIACDPVNVYKVPENINSETATLVEPLSVGVHAIRKSGVSIGDNIIVYGAGIIGISCMLAAKAAGAKSVTIVDIRDFRLSFAKKMGADKAVNISSNLDNIKKHFFDKAFECTGDPASLFNAGKHTRPGGDIVLIGLGANLVQEAPIVDFIINEQNLISVFRYAHAYPIALSMIDKNKNLLENLITHRFNFSETEKAFNAALGEEAMKVVINLD